MDFANLQGHITRAPGGGTQSMLEGIFNPGSSYGQITQEIVRHLTTSDLNAMRGASSTMNTALTRPNAAGVNYRSVTQDRCDSHAQLRPGSRHLYCKNRPNNRLLIRYCEDCANQQPPRQTKICAHCRLRWMEFGIPFHYQLEVGTPFRYQLQVQVHGIGWSPW